MRVSTMGMGALALVCALGRAEAAPLTAAEILTQFNAVVTGNLSTPSDIEGRTVVGGNLTGGATFYNNPGSPPPASAFRALTVYGSSTVGNPININNGGGVTIVGTAAGSFNLNGGGGQSINGVGATAPNPLPAFSTFSTALNGLSTSLAALGANSIFPAPNSTPGWPNNVPVAASAGTGLAVFHITAAQIAQLASFSVGLNGRDAIVFNVTGNLNGTPNFQGGSANLAQRIIWNFTDATSLTFTTQWWGTVLAPNATVTNNTPIEGTLYAAAYNGTGELHRQPFSQGSLLPGASPPVAVPEPASLALFGLGAVGLIALRRRPQPAAA